MMMMTGSQYDKPLTCQTHNWAISNSLSKYKLLICLIQRKKNERLSV